MKILSPETAGRLQVLKQSGLFDGLLVVVMKSIKFHCHKITKQLLHCFKEMEWGTMGSILRPTKIADFFHHLCGAIIDVIFLCVSLRFRLPSLVITKLNKFALKSPKRQLVKCNYAV